MQANHKPILLFGFLLCASVGIYYFVDSNTSLLSPQTDSEENIRTQQNIDFSGKDQGAATANHARRTSSAIAQVLDDLSGSKIDFDASSNNEENLELAHEAMRSGNPDDRISAFELIAELAPAEAVNILHALSEEAKTDPDVAQLLASGVVKLANDKAHLPDTDLKMLYDLNDAQLQKVSAITLSERGDDSLTQRYLASRSGTLKSSAPYERKKALEDVVSVGKFTALPYVINSLNDEDTHIKLQALALLAAYGSNKNITAAEPLLHDTNAQVKAQAQNTIDTLWNKNTAGVLTQNLQSFPTEDNNANTNSENLSNGIDENKPTQPQNYWEDPDEHMTLPED